MTNTTPPLTACCIPVSMFRENLRSILTQDEWDVVRRTVYQRAGYTCQICASWGEAHPVEAHEEWTFDDKKHIQNLFSIMALCPLCHYCKHPSAPNILFSVNEMIQHYNRVNEWDETFTREYIQKELWQAFDRGMHDWELDVTLLDKDPHDDPQKLRINTSDLMRVRATRPEVKKSLSDVH